MCVKVNIKRSTTPPISNHSVWISKDYKWPCYWVFPPLKSCCHWLPRCFFFFFFHWMTWGFYLTWQNHVDSDWPHFYSKIFFGAFLNQNFLLVDAAEIESLNLSVFLMEGRCSRFSFRFVEWELNGKTKRMHASEFRLSYCLLSQQSCNHAIQTHLRQQKSLIISQRGFCSLHDRNINVGFCRKPTNPPPPPLDSDKTFCFSLASIRKYYVTRCVYRLF